MADYEEIERALKSGNAPVQVSDMSDSAKAYFISELLREERAWKLVITYDENKAKRLYDDISSFFPNVFLYPAKDLLFFDADIRSSLISKERIEIWKRMGEDESGIVVTTIEGLMDKLEDYHRFQKSMVRLREKEVTDLKELEKKLVELGYERNVEVEGAGQFSLRGGIIDIYPLTEELPVRIEFWDDEIDSLRRFEIESQRSVDRVDELCIYPAKEVQRGGSCSFLRYWDLQNSLIYLDEPQRIHERAKLTEKEFKEGMAGRIEAGQVSAEEIPEIFTADQVLASLQNSSMLCLCALAQRLSFLEIGASYSLSSRQAASYTNSFELLIEDLKRFRREKYRVVLATASRTRARRLAQGLRDYGLSAYYGEEEYEKELQKGQILVVYGNLHSGFEYGAIKFLVISESDIFGQVKKKKRKAKSKGGNISSLSELSPGDYVVHEDHGIGIYRGIEKIEKEDMIKDYIKIEYAGGDSCYLPATKLDIIQKYAAAEAKRPKLNRLGGNEWKKTKSRVKTAVEEIARDLVELYALRLKGSGYAYGEDTVWQREFEELFPFEETEDQLRAIEDVKADMESGKIMDRLICGDVGYGKTEVAMRAAFKAVQESKQVIYLVPTTILAKQHYNNFKERMKEFPVRIDLLCRFKTAAEQKKTIKDFNQGSVDIIIGTHKALSKDISPRDLGIMIIDEEQRFGVRHKEKLKKLKENVGVLTLTATPIPRTLHMSLAGIRDLSILEEAPMDRKPIQTYVMEYHDEIAKEAIKREVSRGGQVYYVYNHIESIADMAGKLQKLLPECNIVFAHGKMQERELEEIMLDFINKEIDVLVSTTIIETGLDIPNVNTIIIHDADKFGLSQLYQLRGRVGRSSRRAYAFLLYRRNKLLSQEAEKRLKAIREFTELGSGIKIAMRDLEIRGAGNVLGSVQHGHMQAVGYELYCKLLGAAVSELKTGVAREEGYSTCVELEGDAYIPYEYISNEEQKLDIYKRIALIESKEDYSDMQDELIDRFGDPPSAVINLLNSAMIKSMAYKLYIKEVLIGREKIELLMYEKAEVNTENIPEIVSSYGGRLGIVTAEKVLWRLAIEKQKADIGYAISECIRLLEAMECLKLA